MWSYITLNIFCTVWMKRWLSGSKHWLLLYKTQVQFPAHIWWLTTIITSASEALFWSPQAPGTQMLSIHTCCHSNMHITQNNSYKGKMKHSVQQRKLNWIESEHQETDKFKRIQACVNGISIIGVRSSNNLYKNNDPEFFHIWQKIQICNLKQLKKS